MLTPDQFRVNEAWIVAKVNDAFVFVKDVPYDIYMLVDAASIYVFGNLVAGREPKFLEVFPKGDEEERKRFELLRKAYIEARYEENYSISKEDLKWPASRVEIPKDLTEKNCKNKMESCTI